MSLQVGPSTGIRTLDTIIMLIDANGKSLWSQVFDEAEYETIRNILVLSNGEVVIFGILHESNYERQLREGYYDDWKSEDKIWIAKLNFQKETVNPKSSNGTSTSGWTFVVCLLTLSFFLFTKKLFSKR